MPNAMDRTLQDLRVLLVEDQWIIAMVLRTTLTDLGCTVLEPVATAPEALNLLAAERPDAALLDLNLNGTGATPVAKALTTLGIPFAVVVAPTDTLTEPLFGGVPRVVKPFVPEQIEAVLRQLMGQGRPPASARGREASTPDPFRATAS
jgi:CheY-like chemotaxis protein